eukprot:GHRQ01024485.1.p1 GENE.GHRQ01024485.1~~GHRQ01024485.1.p1  ORF type:complete len:171 (+),score=41.52 GHRQ01024485.1:221-733(+)
MAAAAVMPSSAAGLLTLLDDENDELKHYALVHLNKVVHEFWFQIASYIGSVEALYEDDEFKDRELAALIASKVFYHLGELDSALTYALGAGAHFDVDEQSEYVQTLVGKQQVLADQFITKLSCRTLQPSPCICSVLQSMQRLGSACQMCSVSCTANRCCQHTTSWPATAA